MINISNGTEQTLNAGMLCVYDWQEGWVIAVLGDESQVTLSSFRQGRKYSVLFKYPKNGLEKALHAACKYMREREMEKDFAL